MSAVYIFSKMWWRFLKSVFLEGKQRLKLRTICVTLKEFWGVLLSGGFIVCWFVCFPSETMCSRSLPECLLQSGMECNSSSVMYLFE